MMYAVGIFNERLSRERHLMPRMIVCCRTYGMCSDLFIYFKSILLNPQILWKNKHGLVNMFLGCTQSDVKEELVQQFTAASTHSTQTYFCNISFWNGCKLFDVKQIIHIGVPEDTESYIQGAGCAGEP